MKHVTWAAVVVVMGMMAVGLASTQPAQTVASHPPGQSDNGARFDEICARLDRIEGRLARRTSGAVLLLFGGFCALWAQYSKRCCRTGRSGSR